MLKELYIKNFAIIEELHMRFEAGLITFTGETGAGKSIIIDAVETLLGGRAEATMVRSGADGALIEATFRIPPAARQTLHTILEREALLDEPDYLILGREIRVSDRNIARVNGRVVTTALLRELGEHLIDVHGQSEHLSLLRVPQHLGLLDRYAITTLQNSTLTALENYQVTYKRLSAVESELMTLRQVEAESNRRAELLAFQVDEIKAARLRPDEEKGLLEERTRLSNAEGLANAAQEALQDLDDGTPESPAATDLFGQVIEALEVLARLDPTQTERHEEAQALFESLSELARNLRLYLEGIEFNPERLDQVEERLALIQSLKRKFGASIPAILDSAAKAQRQLDEISNAAERIGELKKEQSLLLARLGKEGATLSEKRQAAAKQLEREIDTQLNDLNMSGARFQVGFTRQPDPAGAPLSNGQRVAYHSRGLERIEFLIAPNPGEGFKPLAKIASGGETSRLMLALKNVLAQADHIPTLIFDEIDQGIGGRVGTIVGQKLWQLGQGHQVLCVTHLPQLAAYGGQHLHVEKLIQGERTIAQVKRLAGQERLTELAQMLGTISQGTLQSAEELLHTAQAQTGSP